jgi:serine/threonine protein kinase
MTLPSGFRLGVYEVISLIGRGGMGEVYRARDTRLGREVALKTLPDAVAMDPDNGSRLMAARIDKSSGVRVL